MERCGPLGRADGRPPPPDWLELEREVEGLLALEGDGAGAGAAGPSMAGGLHATHTTHSGGDGRMGVVGGAAVSGVKRVGATGCGHI